MSNNNTLLVIKPEIVKEKRVGEILRLIEKSSLDIIRIQMVHMNIDQANYFYKEHKGKDFFERLTNFMCSGPCVGIILRSNDDNVDAIQLGRKIVRSLRSIYANPEISHENAIHGSDSIKSYINEVNALFNKG